MAEDRRDTLLRGAVAYVLGHGIGGLSLRPLAAALDTSDRMLVYHFGSKDRLVDEVLAAASAQLLTAAAAPYVRLFFEVYGLALQRPERYGPGLRAVAAAWHDAVAERLDGDERAATVVIAGVEGLLLDLLVSGDRARVDEAAADLASRLDPR